MVTVSPQAAARQILSAVGPTTVVSVQSNVYVAGRAAYQLSLVPRSSKSLVGQVLIAIDASRHIPLRIEVFPRGSSSLAYSFGYTSLTFGTPAASNFTFTPPAGATVRTQTLPANFGGLGGGLGLRGLGLRGLGLRGLALGGLGLPGLGLPGLGLGALTSPAFPAVSGTFSSPRQRVVPPGPGGTSIKIKVVAPRVAVRPKGFAFGWIGSGPLKPGTALPKAVIKQITAQFARTLPKSMSAAKRAQAIATFEKRLESRPALGAPAIARLKAVPAPAAKLSQPGEKTIGSGWLTVVATPPSAQVAQAMSQALAGLPRVGPSPSGTSYIVNASLSSASAVASSSGPAVAAPGLDFGVLHALLKAMTPVHGSWGSGRLLQTRLLTVLITSKGQILAGAVTPALLYADVALDAS
jgi:hypothetical protein